MARNPRQKGEFNFGWTLPNAYQRYRLDIAPTPCFARENSQKFSMGSSSSPASLGLYIQRRVSCPTMSNFTRARVPPCMRTDQERRGCFHSQPLRESGRLLEFDITRQKAERSAGKKHLAKSASRLIPDPRSGGDTFLPRARATVGLGLRDAGQDHPDHEPTLLAPHVQEHIILC
jgi:hypothetical protein